MLKLGLIQDFCYYHKLLLTKGIMVNSSKKLTKIIGDKCGIFKYLRIFVCLFQNKGIFFNYFPFVKIQF
jgi:hypothetical protein